MGPRAMQKVLEKAPKVFHWTKPCIFPNLTVVFSHFSHFGNLNVRGHAYSSSPLTLLKINTYFPHISTLLYLKRFNIIFPSKIMSSNLSISFRFFFRRKLCINLSSSHACHMLRPQLRHSCSFTVDTNNTA